MAETTQSTFTRNAQVALQDGTFEDILKALIIKLQELGVPNAETPDEADKINHPLKMAYSKAQTPEQSDLAWNDLSTRILALGSLLPPEATDGAFLADRSEVEELNKKWDNFWSARLWVKMNEESPVGPSHADERNEDGDAGLLDSGFFDMSHEESRDAMRSIKTGRASWEYQPSPIVAQPFTDAFINNIEIAYTHSGGFVVLMALSIKLIQLGVPSAENIDEAAKTNFALWVIAVDPNIIAGQSPEEQQLMGARRHIRILSLGSKLPPEAADGAFLAERGQVRALFSDWSVLKGGSGTAAEIEELIEALYAGSAELKAAEAKAGAE